MKYFLRLLYEYRNMLWVLQSPASGLGGMVAPYPKEAQYENIGQESTYDRIMRTYVGR